jgi:hypothetical protein
MSEASSKCVTPVEPGQGEVVSHATCSVVELDSLHTAQGDLVLAARYVRWVRSTYATWLDSLEVHEVVLFETDEATRTASPVWHRVGADNFLGELEWGRQGRVHLLQLFNCLRGTGGRVEEVLMRDQGQWSVVELPFLDALQEHLPEGYRLHKGRHIDLSTLRFEQPIATQGDANCCPSATLVGTLRLEGRRLRLHTVEVRGPSGL